MAVVLLTDGLERSTLAAARSLVRAGHRVHVLASRARSLAGVSRGVREHVIARVPAEPGGGFVADVAELAGRVGAEVLIPLTDASAIALLAEADRLPPACRVPFPRPDAFLLASDKVALLRLAESAGFAVPRSVTLQDSRSARPRDLEGLVPGVLKAHRSVVRVGDRLHRHSVLRFETVDEGAALLRSLPEAAFPVLGQQRIEGPGVGYFALRWGGAIRAAFAHRRIREIPPWGGVSVCRESFPLDPALARAGERLLELLDWEGVAMIECKQEASSGRYFIMEINPRFWGSLQLAIDAGVDFPALLVDWALGGEPPSIMTYRVGIRSRWLWGELDHAYLRMKFRQRRDTALGALLRAAGELIRWNPRTDRTEVLRFNDPGPFVVESFRRLHLLR